MCRMEPSYTKLAWPELSRLRVPCSMLPYPMGDGLRRLWGVTGWRRVQGGDCLEWMKGEGHGQKFRADVDCRGSKRLIEIRAGAPG